MIAILRPLFDALFPPSLARAAGRVGMICFVLAVCVAVLFPSAARAGTEVPTARLVTAAALALAGAALTFGSGRIVAVGAGVAALAVGALLAPAGWLLLVAGGTCIYCASAVLPRAASSRPARGAFDGTDAAGLAGGGLAGIVVGRVGDAAHGDDEPEAKPEAAQEMIEALATALVLALVVREFGFEAFKIPTGSMEPTILGDGRDRKGDRLLAFKPVAYRRWDIVVFKFPLFRNTNYIKRLIGLPGEHLELRGGDVYVNGAIASKPDDVQEVMWRKVFEPKADSEWVADFEPDAQGAWKLRQGFAEADARNAAGTDSVAWLQARFGFEEDQRISFDVELPNGAPGQLLVSLEGGKRRCELELDERGGKLTGPGLDVSVAGVRLGGAGSKVRLGFSMSDRISRVYVNGRQVASFAHADSANGGLDQGRVRIGVKNQAVVIRNVIGENDVQYGNNGTTTFDIPADGYVMLGDNTWSSRDSRMWNANVVRTKDGREFVAPDYARVTEEREESVFRSLPDGGVEMTDSHGVPRRFTKDEIESVRKNVAQPFAYKDDLVGRAFVIFFPWPSSMDFLQNPVRDFRPRLLR
ncbi:MAG: signal peptidase I [Planctomycetes bacterium]|nr:signal peptidase I [Planctomycetota bacterium]